MKLKTLLILIFPAFLFSCMTVPKNVIYFQDLDKYRQNILLNDTAIYEPVIRKYDELLITVSAPVLDQVNVAQFNLPLTAYLTPGETEIQQSPSIQTYIVDRDGAINYPVIGRIHLAGLTKSQAIEHIRTLVSNYISDPIINMRIISYRIIILGEVVRPGPITISQDRISILDAIGAAGGLSIYGNRQNVLLIRENDNGSRDFIRFDLTKSDLFTSPYYYLQQNDKIIVEPNKTRLLDSKYGAAEGYKLSVLSMAFSAFFTITSTTITIFTLLRK